MGSSIFVTATDTGAGKSFVTAALTRTLLTRGCDVAAIKPIACGRLSESMNQDVAKLLEARGMDAARAGEINLYDFPAFAAPLFAAQQAGENVELESLLNWCAHARARHALTLIEGVGGLMVPLTRDVLVRDWLRAMPEAEVLLVVRARLGGINQALLTLEALKAMNRSPAWVLINAADAEGEAMLDQHCEAITPRVDTASTLMVLPHALRQGYVQASLPEVLLNDMMRRCFPHRAD